MNGAQATGLTGWLDGHWRITYLLIYICLVFIYNKVFRARRLPVLKALIVYVLMALGGFILLAFQIDLQLPILYCMAVAILLMLIVRVRCLVVSWAGKRKERP